MLCRRTPLLILERRNGLFQQGMTPLTLLTVEVRHPRQHHLAHENERLELRAHTQTGHDQIGRGNVPPSGCLERLRRLSGDFLDVIFVGAPTANVPWLSSSR